MAWFSRNQGKVGENCWFGNGMLILTKSILEKLIFDIIWLLNPLTAWIFTVFFY